VGQLISVNVGAAGHHDITSAARGTGIDKRPVTEPVWVRAPGPKGVGASGVIGDDVCDLRHHGGDEQAVYAYAREDLDHWQAELGRELANGAFGENLTTTGLDLTNAVAGERWQIGAQVVLEACAPRLPCGTFASWLEERRWVKRFTAHGATGVYFRVHTPGPIRVGDPITVTHRPAHGVTIGYAFRALTTEPSRLPNLLAAPELAGEALARARSWQAKYAS
jgi:MOSC domain-containing protein YiiM